MVRWEALFADLEARAAAEQAAAQEAELADRTRHARGEVALADRCAAAAARADVVLLDLLGHGSVEGHARAAGPDWVLLRRPTGRELLVALAAVTSAVGLPATTVPVAPHRLDLRRAVRGLVRDRAVLRLWLADGRQPTGTPDVVAADHLDLAEHGAEDERRAPAVRRVRAVPLTALVALERV